MSRSKPFSSRFPPQCIFVASFAVLIIQVGNACGEDSRADYFEKHVRPVLIEHCLECHSDATELSGGLSLDSPDGWRTGGELGAAIKPGAADESLLVRAIEFSDPNLQMPPDGKLTAPKIEAIRTWVDEGAFDPRKSGKKLEMPQTGLPVAQAHRHWAYRPITEPTVTNLIPGASFIDQWINQGLFDHDLQPAPIARRQPLLRRLTFDLTGLPPNASEIDQFLEDDGINAYERLIERLLASPNFGHHFARRWMDVARYAESITLRGFVLHDAWRYRDYLVTAFNDDRPFDQMIRDQIAGDLIVSDSLRERQLSSVATTFLAMGNSNLEDQDKTKLEFDHIDEQLETIGRAFLGQTIGCARCHDHKFDPIPTRDYYAMAAIMRSTTALDHANLSKWVRRPFPMDSETENALEGKRNRIAELGAQLAEINKRLSELSDARTKRVPVKSLSGVVVDDENARYVGQWTESVSVGGFVGTGYRHAKGTGVESKPANQIDTATFEPTDLPGGTYEVRLSYTASGNRPSNLIAEVFSANESTKVIVNQRKPPPEDGIWVSLGHHTFEKGGQAYVMLTTAGADGVVIADAVQFLPIAKEIANEIANKAEITNKTEVAQNGSEDDEPGERQVKELKAKQKRLLDLLKPLEKLLSEREMFVSVRESKLQKELAIRVRGNTHQLGEKVSRGFLSAIGRAGRWAGDLSDSDSGRLAMANWIADPENQLTSRVYVNRVWCWLMGEGLVTTENNFGTTGTAPTHPELLDQLAIQFMQDGWSTKRLVRRIVMSEAYRRSSDCDHPKAVQFDPSNHLYWRANSKRIPVESIHDAMTFISGELDQRVGGSGIKPATSSDYKYDHDSVRRSIYWPVFRNSLPSLYKVFDFADSSISVGQRNESIVATQALVMLNHPWVIERSNTAAERLRIDTDGSQLVESIYLRCLGRSPTDEERDHCQSYLGQSPDSKKLATLIHSIFASIDFRYLD